MQCSPGVTVLNIRELPNYDSRSADHILFLNFRITGKAGGRERVELAGTNLGVGRMKNIYHPVNFPVRIKAIPRYGDVGLEEEMTFEHPLYRSAEVSDESGHIDRKEVEAKEGSLQVRMPVRPGLNALELFSVTPEKGTVKIYTLHFDQP
ncbi:hypothetical protein GCM10010967_27060 [Dyadobacter beijingensis]|uniref:Uncharacterized protein n=2 Tax=Dyadobacter beijingensis TaxID=365489 RepID=A0ABQ2HX81_9BACT|nr:hypothetical protein GCM10010967_27060 [Dyadobacter beijingensis]